MDANPAEGANQLTYPVADETFRNKSIAPGQNSGKPTGTEGANP